MLPEDLRTLAEHQLGVVARFQLLQGLDRHQARTLLRCGLLTALQRGVYRVNGGAPLPDQQAIAAALRARNAQLTGPFVLGRLRLDGFDGASPFEVLVRPGRSLRNVDFRWRHAADFDRPGSRLGAVRLASPSDALIDSGRFRAELGDRALRVAYDQLRWRNLLDTDRFVERLAARPDDDPGAVGLRAALSIADLRCEAEGERDLGTVLQAFDPAPEPQVWVTSSRRADWYFRLLRLVVEFDGGVDHRYPDRRAADAARRQELEEAGIRVVSFTADDLAPVDDLLARLAGILTLRARELGVAAPVYRG